MLSYLHWLTSQRSELNYREKCGKPTAEKILSFFSLGKTTLYIYTDHLITIIQMLIFLYVYVLFLYSLILLMYDFTLYWLVGHFCKFKHELFVISNILCFQSLIELF